MFGFGIFDAVIGLVLIYIFLSLIATAINEAFMTTFSRRGRNLEKAIMIMLNDHKRKGLAEKFYSHPLIVKLGKGGKNNRPSYISKENFSKAFLDLLGTNAASSYTFEDIRENILALKDGETKELLLSILRDSEDNIDNFRKRIESIYEDIMERATGWYKRTVHYFLFIIGFVLAILFNVDSITLSHKLSRDPKDNMAYSISKNEGDRIHKEIVISDSSKNNELLNTLVTMENKKISDEYSAEGIFLALGWNDENIARFTDSGFGVIVYVVGWILTAFAVSLGAPFWFDMMKKVVNVRGVGYRPGEKGK